MSGAAVDTALPLFRCHEGSGFVSMSYYWQAAAAGLEMGRDISRTGREEAPVDVSLSVAFLLFKGGEKGRSTVRRTTASSFCCGFNEHSL